ncbi:hypothetical protein [Pseudomonas sp. dw_612]|uniref:hypothetical protein n=1 Tax=Pseudomonas sp. dw_612 TaxID=2720080 RepID=UPI001BD1F09A|nr:hypothetical protein [Pseudomonas sp. dw_612]
MAKLLDIRMDEFVSHIKEREPITLGFSLVTDGTPPPVGSRLQFRMRPGVTLLHASMPAEGARMIHDDAWDFRTILIEEEQTSGWTFRRTLTLQCDQELSPVSAKELCGIVYYQPDSMENFYCPVLGRKLEGNPIQARQVFKGSWQDQATKGWIYSYDVILRPHQQAITQWKFLSSGLPLGTKIHANAWLNVTHAGPEGVVELVTPKGDDYLLEPGKDLAVSIQLLYPAAVGQNPSLQRLPNLVAYIA